MTEHTCQRTITEKDWTGRRQRKCGRKATHQQTDGLPLCERHYNRWLKKNRKAEGRVAAKTAGDASPQSSTGPGDRKEKNNG